ncbi:MAG TPA: matrixin family metalloprotease [Blastocatellia bacterium]|nr:matrixin family metalloprotease [Blastocatellia bacterium]
MIQLRRKILNLALPLLALFLLYSPAQATVIIPLSDEELAVTSRFIVKGNVRSVISAWDDSNRMIWTYVEISSDSVLKGDLSAQTIVLKQAGGFDGMSGIHVFGQPDFTPGQEVLLFLNTAPDGSLRVAHAFLGLYSIVEDPLGGEKMVTRSYDARGIEFLSRNDSSPVTDRALYKDFLRKIKTTLQLEAARVEQLDAERAHLPVLTEPLEYRRKKKESRGIFPHFSFMGGGVRWMEADSGQAVSFNVNPNRSPIAGGASAELSRAMSAWSGSGAGIRLQMGGQTGSCGISADGANTISFADCLGELDPPVGGCAGVVGLTSVRWVNSPRIINGRSFNPLIEADIVFNDGMDCFLANSANLAEVACHELGHAIGLGHSEDTSAMMFASAHGRGRDATLGDDDRAGAQAIYPGSPGSGGGGGGGGGSPLSITSFSMPDGVIDRFYRFDLTASGGAPPYRWHFITGSMPPGLNLSSSGVIDGVPTRTGSFAINVQVIDSSSGNASRWMTLNIGANNSGAFPVITRVKIKRSKKLFVYGSAFTQDSVIILNGVVLPPRSLTREGNLDRLMYKGSIPLGATGTNALYVQNNNNRSAGFFF